MAAVVLLIIIGALAGLSLFLLTENRFGDRDDDS